MKLLTEWDALVQSIIEEPEDDGLRLMAADWLADNGREGYGEWIKACMKDYWRPPTTWEFRNWFGPALPPYYEDHLSNKPRWWLRMKNEQGLVMMEISLKRGFIEAFEGTLEAFQAHGPLLCQKQPITKVEITNRGPATTRKRSGGKTHYTWFKNAAWDGMMEWVPTDNDTQRTLPEHLMPSGKRQINFASLDLANYWLSNQLIAWARKQPL